MQTLIQVITVSLFCEFAVDEVWRVLVAAIAGPANYPVLLPKVQRTAYQTLILDQYQFALVATQKQMTLLASSSKFNLCHVEVGEPVLGESLVRASQTARTGGTNQ